MDKKTQKILAKNDPNEVYHYLRLCIILTIIVPIVITPFTAALLQSKENMLSFGLPLVGLFSGALVFITLIFWIWWRLTLIKVAKKLAFISDMSPDELRAEIATLTDEKESAEAKLKLLQRGIEADEQLLEKRKRAYHGLKLQVEDQHYDHMIKALQEVLDYCATVPLS